MITIYPGETKRLNVKVTDTDDNPVNLGGADMAFCVRRSLGAPDLLIQKTVLGAPGGIVITNAGAGEAQITILPTDTINLPPAECVYDLWVTLSGGDQLIAIRPSLFEVKQAVTLLT